MKRRIPMIEGLMQRLGFVPKEALDEAWYRGRLDGQAEMRERCEYEVSAVRAQYAGIQRERDHLMKLIAERVALDQALSPQIITIENRNG